MHTEDYTDSCSNKEMTSFAREAEQLEMSCEKLATVLDDLCHRLEPVLLPAMPVGDENGRRVCLRSYNG